MFVLGLVAAYGLDLEGVLYGTDETFSIGTNGSCQRPVEVKHGELHPDDSTKCRSTSVLRFSRKGLAPESDPDRPPPSALHAS